MIWACSSSSAPFSFAAPAPSDIPTLSLHDALPISRGLRQPRLRQVRRELRGPGVSGHERGRRSEEHTSELQSPCNLVCRLLLEKKKTTASRTASTILPRASSRALSCGDAAASTI